MTQVSACWSVEWGKLCRIGSVLVYIPASLPSSSQPPFWDCETVTKRLKGWGMGERARASPASLLIIYHVWFPTYHTPPSPLYQSRRERLQHVCIASSLTIIGLGSFSVYDLASFKTAVKKCLFVGLIIFVFCFVFLSQKTTNNLKKKKERKKKEQIKCGGDVPKNHSGITSCCSTLICSYFVK